VISLGIALFQAKLYLKRVSHFRENSQTVQARFSQKKKCETLLNFWIKVT